MRVECEKMSCFIAIFYLDYMKSWQTKSHIMTGRVVLILRAHVQNMNQADKTTGKLCEIRRTHVV